MNDGTQLRKQFESLRRAEEAGAPTFERVISLARGRSRRAAPWLALAASIVLAAVTGVVVRLSHLRSTTIHAAAPMLADWRAPTDFLLDTPGRELLHTVPDIGRSPSTFVAPLPPTHMTTPARRAAREHS